MIYYLNSNFQKYFCQTIHNNSQQDKQNKMSTNLGQSAQSSSKINNDGLISENISRSIRGVGQKYMQKQDKIAVQLEYMRLQQQYRKEVSLWEQQLNQLRLEVDRHQQLLHQAESKQLQQKQQINTLHKQNLKLFQQNQKHKKLMNTLKADNQALQLQIQRWKSDRKTYSTKLDSIYELKKNMNLEIAQKNSLIQDQQVKIRQLQKRITQYKLKTEQLSATLTERQRDNKQLGYQVKSHLQSFLELQNIVNKLQHEIHQTNQFSITLKEKIMQLEKDKEVLLQRIYELNTAGGKSDRSQEGYEEENGCSSRSGRQTRKQQGRSNQHQPADLQSIITPADQRLMLQIQSFMREFQCLLERKAQQRQISIQNTQKVLSSIECLQRII